MEVQVGHPHPRRTCAWECKRGTHTSSEGKLEVQVRHPHPLHTWKWKCKWGAHTHFGGEHGGVQVGHPHLLRRWTWKCGWCTHTHSGETRSCGGAGGAPTPTSDVEMEVQVGRPHLPQKWTWGCRWGTHTHFRCGHGSARGRGGAARRLLRMLACMVTASPTARWRWRVCVIRILTCSE